MISLQVCDEFYLSCVCHIYRLQYSISRVECESFIVQFMVLLCQVLECRQTVFVCTMH